MSGGLLITFEGGEGTGKTTQIALLAERLGKMGVKVLVTREPGGTPLGTEIRKHLVRLGGDPPTPRAELLLYEADRAHHVEKVIRPALLEGATVLCDRYADATLAYQGYGRGLDLELVEMLNCAATGGLMPVRTIWLKLDPVEGVKRSLARQIGDSAQAEARFEAEEKSFHERVQRGYEALSSAEPARIRKVEGGGEVEEVERRIWEEVKDLFEGAGP